jgi:hypothetical protein
LLKKKGLIKVVENCSLESKISECGKSIIFKSMLGCMKTVNSMIEGQTFGKKNK